MLTRTTLLLAATVALLSVAASPAVAIVGGDPAPPGRWPWMVALLRTDQKGAFKAQFCGGTLIAPRRVLTAAHCVADDDAGDVDVLIGRDRLTAAGGRQIHVRRIDVFPRWESEAAPGLDAAVLTLTADAGVAPVAIARAGATSAFGAGAPAWTVGWGRLNGETSPGGSSYYADRLREVALPIVSDDACERAYGGGNGDLVYRPGWTICAGSGAGDAGSCFGDSGGPLVVGTDGAWLQVGIVQGGDSCASPGYYDLFARVDKVSAFALGALGRPRGSGANARRGRRARAHARRPPLR